MQNEPSEEVQSMHFGASKTQVTLHTGVIFFKGGQKSFCTVSPSNVHQPHAIWAHLKPIINLDKTFVSNIKRIHILKSYIRSYKMIWRKRKILRPSKREIPVQTLTGPMTIPHLQGRGKNSGKSLVPKLKGPFAWTYLLKFGTRL